MPKKHNKKYEPNNKNSRVRFQFSNSKSERTNVLALTNNKCKNNPILVKGQGVHHLKDYLCSRRQLNKHYKQDYYDMEKLIINSYAEFEEYVGKVLGTSDYVQVDQDRINLFADATLDNQWIHVDQERAKEESPFKSTIAHGYLTLSLLPYMWNQIIEVNNLKMMINYGIEKMKFGQAVLCGNSVRLTTKLESLVNLRGAAKAEIKFSIEVKETGKKALEGIAIFIYYFN